MSDGKTLTVKNVYTTSGTITVTTSAYIPDNQCYIIPATSGTISRNIIYTNDSTAGSYYQSDHGLVWYTSPEDPVSRLKRFLKESNYKE